MCRNKRFSTRDTGTTGRLSDRANDSVATAFSSAYLSVLELVGVTLAAPAGLTLLSG